jgi:hypothetical protein
LRDECDPQKLSYKNEVKQMVQIETKPIDCKDIYYEFQEGTPNNDICPHDDLRTCINFYLKQFYRYDISYTPLNNYLIDTYGPIFWFTHNEHEFSHERFIKSMGESTQDDFVESAKECPKQFDQFARFLMLSFFVMKTMAERKYNAWTNLWAIVSQTDMNALIGEIGVENNKIHTNATDDRTAEDTEAVCDTL